jgi:hypothetical protein
VIPPKAQCCRLDGENPSSARMRHWKGHQNDSIKISLFHFFLGYAILTWRVYLEPPSIWHTITFIARIILRRQIRVVGVAGL